jgi:hypothetical protein
VAPAVTTTPRPSVGTRGMNGNIASNALSVCRPSKYALITPEVGANAL